jgi:endonuclease YncB( thermonuclease family)
MTCLRRSLALTLVLALALGATNAQDARLKPRAGRLLEITDGDTIRADFDGKSESLRLLSVDTEETYHGDLALQREAESDFEAYVQKMRGDATKPVKFGTPFGEETRRFAQSFFDGVDRVEIENDDPAETLCYYGRTLSYVFVTKAGKRINYNVELVRLGYSPYYVKYGRSRRYEKEFIAAEAEAMAGKRGIWGNWKEKSCYPDYRERLAWWRERGEIYQRWRDRVAAALTKPEAERPILISLDADGAWEALAASAGRKVSIFGTINRIRHPEGAPSRIVMAVKKENLDCDLTGRIDDGGRYIRELGIISGECKLISGRPRIINAQLDLPTLESHSVPPAPPRALTPQAPGGEPAPTPAPNGRTRFNFQGPVGQGLKKASIDYRVSVAYGDLPPGALDRAVRLYLSEVTPAEVIEALALSADLPLRKVGESVFVIAAPQGLEAGVATAEAAARAQLFQAEARALETLKSTAIQEPLPEGLRTILDAAREARRLMAARLKSD